MQAVILMGIQGAGKSTFFREQFFTTHVRISLDLMRTRYRARQFLQTCLVTGQAFVVDNTHPTRQDRASVIEPSREAGFSVTGYYFQSKLEGCLERNRSRPERERVPDVGLLATAKKLERPGLQEGFDQLYYVTLKDGQFCVEVWRDEV